MKNWPRNVQTVGVLAMAMPKGQRYERDEDGDVIRCTWIDKIAVKAARFDEFWEHHHKLLWWCARRASKAFGGESSDYIGFMVLRMNKALTTYSEECGPFTTYFCTHLMADVFRHVVRYESDSWALSYVRTARKSKPSELPNEVLYDSDKFSIFYHIPDNDGLFDELIKCFRTLDDLWRFLCKPLDQRTTNIVYWRYKYGMTLEALASQQGVTKQRILQLISRALEKIKKRVGELEKWVKLFKVRDEELADHYFSEPEFGKGRFWTGDEEPRPNRKKRRGSTTTPQTEEIARKKKRVKKLKEPVVMPSPVETVPVSGALSLIQLYQLVKNPGHNLKSFWQDGRLIVTRDGESVLCRFMSQDDARELCGRLTLEMVG